MGTKNVSKDGPFNYLRWKELAPNVASKKRKKSFIS